MSSTFTVPDSTYIIISREGKMKVSYADERLFFVIPDHDALKILETIQYHQPKFIG